MSRDLQMSKKALLSNAVLTFTISIQNVFVSRLSHVLEQFITTRHVILL